MRGAKGIQMDTWTDKAGKSKSMAKVFPQSIWKKATNGKTQTQKLLREEQMSAILRSIMQCRLNPTQ